MRLEEILPLIRENKKIEYLGRDRNGCPEWKNFDYSEGDYSFSDILNYYEFRIKKEKVKRYQVLYTYCNNGKVMFDCTKNKYKDWQEFYDKTENINRNFESLILRSEEEFDE